MLTKLKNFMEAFMAKNQNKFFLGNLDATGQYTGYRLAFKPNIAEARAFN